MSRITFHMTSMDSLMLRVIETLKIPRDLHETILLLVNEDLGDGVVTNSVLYDTLQQHCTAILDVLEPSEIGE